MPGKQLIEIINFRTLELIIHLIQTCAGEKPVAAIRSRTNVAKIEFRSDRSVATMVLTIKNDSMEILM